MKKFVRKILHFDGDYRLRGMPLVTGGERGAITSASLEAKRLGIGRGVSLWDAKKICPELVVVPGDYLTYSIFAQRMYALVREFADDVEEYSIDECFADITHADKLYKMSHEDIALKIKSNLEKSLGVTFGVGLGPSKVLAKVASKHRKPGGFTVITRENLPSFQTNLPVSKVWGIGPSSAKELERHGILSVKDFVDRPQSWIDENFNKPCRDIWYELQGYSINALNLIPKAPHSVIRSRTFRPPSNKLETLLSQLSINVEDACAKLRRHKLKACEIRFFLKTQDFIYHGLDLLLPVPSSSPMAVMEHITKHINKIYKKGLIYRATGIVFKKLTSHSTTLDLFGTNESEYKRDIVFQAVDKIGKKYGENMIYLATSHKSIKDLHEAARKHLDIPKLGTVS
jgi:DNA polymerase IV